jgi:hypothetical protein
VENVSTCDATVTIEDNLPPLCIAQDIVVSLDFNGEAIIAPEMIDNGSMDQCSDVTFSLSQSSFFCNDIGENDVMLTVTDMSGNTSSCSAIVIVEDKLEPICITQDIIVELNSNGEVAISPEQVDNGSLDNCPFTLSLDKSLFSCDDIGNQVVTLIITDASGNISQCEAGVQVVDPNAYCDTSSCCIENSEFIELVEEGFDVSRFRL